MFNYFNILKKTQNEKNTTNTNDFQFFRLLQSK
jgi:hypothetical protein